MFKLTKGESFIMAGTTLFGLFVNYLLIKGNYKTGYNDGMKDAIEAGLYAKGEQ